MGSSKKYQEIKCEILAELFDVILARKKGLPADSYTASLFKEGLGKICAKVDEESKEVIFAAKKESKKRVVEESVDLIYHLMVLLAERKVGLTDVLKEIKKRRK